MAPIWIQVRSGSAKEYKEELLTDVTNVSGLLDVVFRERSLKDHGIRDDSLKLYTSYEICRNHPDQALDPMGKVPANDMKDGTPIPFYVDYPGVVAGGAPASSSGGGDVAVGSSAQVNWTTETVGKVRLVSALESGKVLDAKCFSPFLNLGTDADRDIYLREHLIDVHNAAVDVLKFGSTNDAKLVSLVGCPGVGKTWCGWLVANTLEHTHKVSTMHLAVSGQTVTAVIRLTERRGCEVSSWRHDVLTELINTCKISVCIVDVSDADAQSIFRSVRTVLARCGNEIKFLCMHSGHGEGTIVGSQQGMKAKKLVLWSWTKDDVDKMSEKLPEAHRPPADAYSVCGGSVRLLFHPKQEADEIKALIMGMSQERLKLFLANDLPSDDKGGKQISRLLAFFRHTDCTDNTGGMSDTYIQPRSRYAILCAQRNMHTTFHAALGLYRRLEQINAGASGSAFELMVHMFWRNAIQNKLSVKLDLFRVDATGKEVLIEAVTVDCKQLPEKPGKMEAFDDKEVAAGVVGYFVPDDPMYPVLDSILRFPTDGGGVKVIAIQVSIAKKHSHAPLDHGLLAQTDAKKSKLALWDFRPSKPCQWTPKNSPSWDLVRINCQQFNDMVNRVA